MADKQHAQWKEYLLVTRQLSPEVIQEAGLFPQGNRLCIPIKNKDGLTLFNKRRLAPWSDAGPKYLYDKGSSATLYGLHFPILDAPTFIVEGEMDVLAMRTAGYNAFSSTGGAMTWRGEWNELIPEGLITIIYDNDKTGMKGAIKTGQSLKHFVFSWIPPVCGKDAGDLLRNTEDIKRFREFIEDDYSRIEINIPDKIDSKFISELSRMAKERPLDHGRDFLFLLAEELSELIKFQKKQKAKPSNYTDNRERVERAKEYPISDIIEVRHHKAICPFHYEKTPSLHVYNNNTAFCFGQCDAAFDAIDIYRKIHNCSFPEALKALAPTYE